MGYQLGFEGLIAATFTPLDTGGALDLDAVAPLVNHLIDQRVVGLYILGSTGEGISLTQEERRAVAERFVKAAQGRVPTIIQVGCECLASAHELASHAQDIGADAVSAVCPIYFKPDSIESLVDSMAQIASGAPKLPFYYYHIPSVTGVNLSMIDFLDRARGPISNLAGIKFTSTNAFEYQSCLEFGSDWCEVLWGLDEMLLTGAHRRRPRSSGKHIQLCRTDLPPTRRGVPIWRPPGSTSPTVTFAEARPDFPTFWSTRGSESDHVDGRSRLWSAAFAYCNPEPISGRVTAS